MNKVSKMAIAIAIKVKEGTGMACSRELDNALRKEVGTYFLGVGVVEAGGVFGYLGFDGDDVYTCCLIFQNNATGAIFERESIVDILERLELPSFDLVAVSHTPYEFTEYEY